MVERRGAWPGWRGLGRRRPASYRMGHSTCTVNTTQNQATRATQLGKKGGCSCYVGNIRVYLSTTASNCSCKSVRLLPVSKILTSHLAPTRSTPYATRQLTTMIVSPLQPLPGNLVQLRISYPPILYYSGCNYLLASTASVPLGMGLAVSSTLPIVHRGASI